MAGKPKLDLNKTQAEEIAQKKAAFLVYYRQWPVKKAAAEAVDRSTDTIEVWIKDDPEFSAAYNSARAEWSLKQSRKLKPDNLLANLYDELKPPKQEIEQTVETSVTITYVNPSDHDQTDPEATPDVAETPRPDNH